MKQDKASMIYDSIFDSFNVVEHSALIIAWVPSSRPPTGTNKLQAGSLHELNFNLFQTINFKFLNGVFHAEQDFNKSKLKEIPSGNLPSTDFPANQHADKNLGAVFVQCFVRVNVERSWQFCRFQLYVSESRPNLMAILNRVEQLVIEKRRKRNRETGFWEINIQP